MAWIAKVGKLGWLGSWLVLASNIALASGYSQFDKEKVPYGQPGLTAAPESFTTFTTTASKASQWEPGKKADIDPLVLMESTIQTLYQKIKDQKDNEHFRLDQNKALWQSHLTAVKSHFSSDSVKLLATPKTSEEIVEHGRDCHFNFWDRSPNIDSTGRGVTWSEQFLKCIGCERRELDGVDVKKGRPDRDCKLELCFPLTLLQVLASFPAAFLPCCWTCCTCDETADYITVGELRAYLQRLVDSAGLSRSLIGERDPARPCINPTYQSGLSGDGDPDEITPVDE